MTLLFYTCCNQGTTSFISKSWHDFVQAYLRSSVSKEGTEVSLTDLISDAVLPTDLILSLSSGEKAPIQAYCLSESAVGEVFFCVHYNGRLNRSGAASSVGHKTAFRPNKTSETDRNQLLSSPGLISESFIFILMCRNQLELLIKLLLSFFYSGSAFCECMFLQGDLVITVWRNVFVVKFIVLVSNISPTIECTVVLIDVKGQLDKTADNW